MMGILANPNVKMNQKKNIKFQHLRNVAVTAPYMHNGVFSDLKL